MKLLRLSYNDLDAQWEFDGLTFHHDVSLLVGASGVGKTRILKAIRQLKAIANDKEGSFNWGINWSTEFSDSENRKYLWKGEFERRGSGPPDSANKVEDYAAEEYDWKRPKIVRESLSVDGREIFDRKNENFTLKGKKVEVKLSPNVSGMIVMSEEDDIKPARAAISQILFVDSSEDLETNHSFIHGNYRKILRQFTNIDAIRCCSLPTNMKLALVHEHDIDIFKEIEQAFREVFPNIEAIKVEEASFPPFGDRPVIMMKEAGVPGYFSQDDLSAGMRRTLMHLARMALWPLGTLILIDEFENSLGANCIDVVSSGILSRGKSLQFVITSHHPFIINAIPLSHWKIIGRSRGQIKFFTTDELKVGRSRQEAFTQLINTDVFKYGILPK